MGYTTRFKLSYTDNDPTTEAAILRFLCIKGLLADDDCFEIEPDGKHWIEFSNKWYDRVWDMLALSAQLPTVQFNLEGEGDSQGDVWEERYLGALCKHIRPRIVWPSEEEIVATPWKTTP